MPKRSGKVYSEIFLHFVWRTKEDVPFITPVVQPVLYDVIAKRIAAHDHITLKGIGGTEDHIHLCVEVSPNIAPVDVVKHLKGASSHHINHLVPRVGELYWQQGYGVLSLGKRNVPWLLKYIDGQEEHHRRGTAKERLERTEEEDA